MAIRYISTADTAVYTPPSPPPKRKEINLEELAAKGLDIALSSMKAAAQSSHTPPSTLPKRTRVERKQVAHEDLQKDLSSTPAAAQPSLTSPSAPIRRKYSNLQALARGGLSEVYQGLTSPGKSPIACKVTRSFYAQNESKLLNELFMNRTPHSVRCRELCDPDLLPGKLNQASEGRAVTRAKLHAMDSAMLITDLIPAQDLHQAFLKSSVLPENRLKRDEIITIFKSLLQYLAKLYSLQIIHRDLKPGNLIYLPSSRQLTVIDLGNGVNLKKISERHPSGQTPGYQAPESIFEDRFNPSIDLWSAGCILFEMVTDQALIPFDYKTPRDQQNNYLLQMIAARIGKPSSEYLKTFGEAKKYFDATFSQFRHPLNIQLEPWEKTFEAAAERKQFSAQDTIAWKSILSKLLTYHQRAQANELLFQEKILSQDICFHFTLLNPQLKEVRVMRSSQVSAKPSPQLSAADFSTPDLVLSNKELSEQHCLHVPRDDQDEYLIYCKRINDSEFIQKVKLDDYCIVQLDEESWTVTSRASLPASVEPTKRRKIPFQLPSSPEASIDDSLKDEIEDDVAPTQPDLPSNES